MVHDDNDDEHNAHDARTNCTHPVQVLAENAYVAEPLKSGELPPERFVFLNSGTRIKIIVSGKGFTPGKYKLVMYELRPNLRRLNKFEIAHFTLKSAPTRFLIPTPEYPLREPPRDMVIEPSKQFIFSVGLVGYNVFNPAFQNYLT